MTTSPASFTAEVTGTPGKRVSKYTDTLLISAICFLLYLAGNGQVSLWDRDEPRYAQCAREMVRSGNFVVPTFNAEPRFHKPVLIYWLMAASYAGLGDNEFAARFWSAIAGTVTCLLTYRLGNRMGGRAVGLAAALMLAVSPLMIVESKLATTDAVLTATVVGAISCLWDLYQAGFSWRRSLLFWVLLGVAILTKGPVGPGIIASGVAGWLLLCRRWGVLRRLNWAAGLAVLTAVVLPWGVAVYAATHGDFFREAIGRHVVGRSLEPMEGHRGFPGFYLATALAGLFPWSLGLTLALRGVRRWAREDGPGSFLLGWMIGPMIVLELVRTKLPHYYLPAYPAWALLIARGLVAFQAAGERLVQSRFGLMRVATLATAGIGTAALLVGAVVVVRPHQIMVPVLAAAAALACGTALAAGLLLRRRDMAAWTALVVTWGLFGLAAVAWVLPRAEVYRVHSTAARELRTLAADQAPIVLHSIREPSLVYYLGKPVPVLSARRDLCSFVRDHGDAYTLLRQRDLAKLTEDGTIQVDILQRIETPKTEYVTPNAVVVARLSPLHQPDGMSTAAEPRNTR